MALHKLSPRELEMFAEMAAQNEIDGRSETRVRNWQLASLLAEVSIARELLDRYGVSDKADQMLAVAPDPLKPADDA